MPSRSQTGDSYIKDRQNSRNQVLEQIIREAERKGQMTAVHENNMRELQNKAKGWRAKTQKREKIETNIARQDACNEIATRQRKSQKMIDKTKNRGKTLHSTDGWGRKLVKGNQKPNNCRVWETTKSIVWRFKKTDRI